MVTFHAQIPCHASSTTAKLKNDIIFSIPIIYVTSGMLVIMHHIRNNSMLFQSVNYILCPLSIRNVRHKTVIPLREFPVCCHHKSPSYIPMLTADLA